LIAQQFGCAWWKARVLFEDALLRAVSAGDADAAVCCSGHAIGCPDWFVRRFPKRRFHHKMQAAIRTDEQRKVVRLAALVRASDIENPLRVFEEYIHAGLIGRLRKI
jgi:hypothetical protein